MALRTIVKEATGEEFLWNDETGEMSPLPKRGVSQSVFGGVAQGALDVGRGLAALPGQLARDVTQAGRSLARMGEIDPRELGPQVLWEAAKATGRDVATPFLRAGPELVGGTVAGALGPAGVPLGMAMGRTAFQGLEGMTTGQAPSGGELARGATAAFTGGVTPTVVGAGIRAAMKAPGRFLSLPAERHAAGATMMEAIPEQFGVDASKVASLYKQAESLSVKSMTQTPLMHFRQRVADMRGQLEMNPVEALRDSGRIDQLTRTLEDLGGLKNTVTPRQADALIKRVNSAIGDTSGSERGMWKQMLGGLHEDMRTAAAKTGDPAYVAYEQAIRSARLNFLKDDLQEVIRNVGVVQQRTGAGVITSPGKILQWMQKNPEWAEAVAKEKPGLLESIGRDLQEIVPITNITGKGIPGQRYGSGRLVLGVAAGHLISKLLGWAPGTAESLGAIVGGLSGHTGLAMSPAYIRSSFRPVPPPTAYPRVGLAAGSLTATRPGGDQP